MVSCDRYYDDIYVLSGGNSRFQSLKNWRKNRELKKKLQHRNDYLYEQNIVQREAESQRDNEIVYTTSEDLLEQRFRKLEKDKQ